MLAVQGDWGTQFGMLIQYLAESRPGGLADPTISELAIHDLQVNILSKLSLLAVLGCPVLVFANAQEGS